MAIINNKKVLQVVKTQFVPAVYQEKTITPQNQTRVITADSGYAALSKVTLDGLLVDPHESYTSSTDSTTAYTKTVPTGALKYAALDKLGGISYKAINLFDKTAVTLDKELGSSGAITDNSNYFVSDYIDVKENETYNYNLGISFNTCFYDIDKNYISGSAYSTTFTTPNNCKYIRMSATKARLDTLMICKGSTAPSSYVEYVGNFEGIRDNAVTSVVSKDSNNTTLDTLTIPAEIQALTGYGWGVNDTCYNYIDFETKKFIQKVGRVDLGSMNWDYISETTRFISGSLQSDIKAGVNTTASNLVCSIYTSETFNDFINNTPNMAVCVSTTSNLSIRNTAYTDATAFKTAMSGVYLVYELATPVETDISEYIDNNFIEVEANGSLTHNNTYNQAVPSEVTYLVEV